jgi:ParB family chromosome partitioning protein
MAPTKHGLGRGLGALIPPSRTSAPAPGVLVPITQITPNPHQPRHRIEAEALRELADSIKEHGIIQPLIVTPAPDSTDAAPHYQLIAGERRWAAAKLAGLDRVPVIIRGASPQEMLELALVENIQRADLNPLEEASAYRSHMDEFGLTQEQVAARVGRDRTTITNALRLLKLPEDILTALADRSITEGHARALLTVNDPRQQGALLRNVIAQGYSVRQTEEVARRMNERAEAAHRRPPRPDRSGRAAAEPEMPSGTESLEDDFRKALGTKVQVFRSREGGKVVIYFYSEEELESIYNKIVGPS